MAAGEEAVARASAWAAPGRVPGVAWMGCGIRRSSWTFGGEPFLLRYAFMTFTLGTREGWVCRALLRV